jgi:hypothetical protein
MAGNVTGEPGGLGRLPEYPPELEIKTKDEVVSGTSGLAGQVRGAEKRANVRATALGVPEQSSNASVNAPSSAMVRGAVESTPHSYVRLERLLNDALSDAAAVGPSEDDSFREGVANEFMKMIDVEDPRI